jgi:putative transposase
LPSLKRCIGDSAHGIWKALGQVYPAAERHRCWVQITANMLDKMPKSVQSSAKSLIHDLHQAETEKDVRYVYSCIQGRYQAKYPRAVEALVKDESTQFTFSLPDKALAAHPQYQHNRISNCRSSTLNCIDP